MSQLNLNDNPLIKRWEEDEDPFEVEEDEEDGSDN